MSGLRSLVLRWRLLLSLAAIFQRVLHKSATALQHMGLPAMIMSWLLQGGMHLKCQGKQPAAHLGYVTSELRSCIIRCLRLLVLAALFLEVTNRPSFTAAMLPRDLPASSMIQLLWEGT